MNTLVRCGTSFAVFVKLSTFIAGLSVKIVLISDAFCAFIGTLTRKTGWHHSSTVITIVSFDVELIIAFSANIFGALFAILGVYAAAGAGFVLL